MRGAVDLKSRRSHSRIFSRDTALRAAATPTLILCDPNGVNLTIKGTIACEAFLNAVDQHGLRLADQMIASDSIGRLRFDRCGLAAAQAAGPVRGAEYTTFTDNLDCAQLMVMMSLYELDRSWRGEIMEPVVEFAATAGIVIATIAVIFIALPVG